jgi:fatty acid desaturase
MLNLKRNEHTAAPAALIVGLYVLIAAIAGVASFLGGFAAPVLAMALIAGLQNHLQILLHEGVHRQVHPDRRWNDRIADLFCAIPFGGLLRHYRHFHLLHHTHLLDPERDPEIGFYAEQGYRFEPLSRAARAKMLFLDFCGYHYFQFFFSYNLYLWTETRAGRMPGLTREEVLRVATVVLATTAAVSLGLGRELLLYWVLPQPTFLFFFLKQQGYGEHSARRGTIANCTHSPEVSWLGRFFVYPLHSNYHREHHLYPTVPWYRLPELQRTLGN